MEISLMIRHVALIALGSLYFNLGFVMAAEKSTPSNASPLAVTMETLDGKEVDLAKEYEGKVVLIVNVASKCGLTPQYKQLQTLHDKYSQEGLAVLGFPCNQFGKQEPGSADEIASFCDKNYGVKFDMFAKIDVNKDTACDLYKTLTSTDTQPVGKGDISWNFEKFLIGRDGQVLARFSPRTKPDDPEVIQAIEKALASK
jgi:glutathione peroxidase